MQLPVFERIEILLNHFKINQKQLAERAGLSENTISNAKKGKNIPGVDFFNSIFKAFPNLNPAWLYLGEGSMFIDGTNPANRTNGQVPVADLKEKIKALEKEIEYLKVQIKDKEEIINLLKSRQL